MKSITKVTARKSIKPPNPPKSKKEAKAAKAPKPLKPKKEGSSFRMPIRIPVRVQITLLMTVFVLAVALISFRSTFSFLEKDKIGTIRELQTLQVADLARDLNDHIVRVRQELKDNAVRLMDTSGAGIQLDSSVWSWLRARGKVWVAPEFKGTIPQVKTPTLSELGFQLRFDTDPEYVIVQENLKVKDSGQESILAVDGRIKKSLLLIEASRFSRGPIQGILFEAPALAKAAEALAGKELQNRIWISDGQAAQAFTRLYSEVPDSLRSSLSRPSQPLSRELKVGVIDDRVLFSWATVPLTGSAMNLVVITFVNQADILRGFLRTKAELGFWVLLVLGFGFFAAGLLGRGLSRPLESMLAAAKILETGNFKIRVKANRNDELGDLAGAFNHLGATLEQREEALEAANTALVQSEKMAALGTLSAGLAHEVKNPLAGILGHADMAAQQIKSLQIPNQHLVLKHVETIQKETKRCRGIIDNLMRFSRNEGQSASDFEAIDVELVTLDAVHLTEHPLNLAKVRIEKNFCEDAYMINGNANQVEQVVLNMLQNAGQAMPSGGTITVTTIFVPERKTAPMGRLEILNPAEFKGAFMRLSIKDTGTGMTEEVQKKIFLPFFTTKPKGQGTGLGLSVTLNILKEHKVRASINSAPGEGTEFVLDFMARSPRPESFKQQLAEIRHNKSGGAKVSTDISVSKAMSPAAAAPVSSAVSKVSAVSSVSTVSKVSRALPTPPTTKISAESPSAEPAGDSFSVDGGEIALSGDSENTQTGSIGLSKMEKNDEWTSGGVATSSEVPVSADFKLRAPKLEQAQTSAEKPAPAVPQFTLRKPKVNS